MKSIITASLLAVSSYSFASSLNDLNYITEIYPPFNYEKEGRLTGIAIDVLEAASEAVNDPVKRENVQLQPWARGYAAALETPNTVLFSMTRTEARNNLFKWAGPIVDSRIVLWAPKSKGIQISTPSDLNDYRIGVVREDIGEQLLRNLEVNANALRPSASPEMVVRQLNANRVDMWAYGDNVGVFIMREQNIDPNLYEIVYVLHESQNYFAFHHSTDDAYVEKLQNGLNLIRESGKLDEIAARYR